MIRINKEKIFSLRFVQSNAFVPTRNKKEVLSFEEMYKLCSGFIQLGIKKIRITGGEPLVRKGIMDFFEILSPHLSSQLEELTLTTNGTQLNKYASQLYANGVRRINISLDTLDPKRFKNITRIGSLQDVLSGIEAAKDANAAMMQL